MSSSSSSSDLKSKSRAGLDRNGTGLKLIVFTDFLQGVEEWVHFVSTDVELKFATKMVGKRPLLLLLYFPSFWGNRKGRLFKVSWFSLVVLLLLLCFNSSWLEFYWRGISLLKVGNVGVKLFKRGFPNCGIHFGTSFGALRFYSLKWFCS